MKRNIGVANSHYEVDWPDECPMCHRYADIKFVASNLLPDKRVQVVAQCPVVDCRFYFIMSYGQLPAPEIETIVPRDFVTAAIPLFIDEISASFKSIFREAEHARGIGLSQIAGPGYRKALEFLIKDYAKSLAPENSESIEGSFVGQVVKDLIDDPRIQTVAKRALWIGNDETHYLRKWSSHDIDDLLTLIRLTISWIEIGILSDKYVTEIPDKESA